MAAAFDAQSSGFVNSGSSITVSHSMGVGANGYLGISFGITAGTTISSVEFNGSPLTQRLFKRIGGLDAYYFDIVTPSSGIHDAVLTYVESGACVMGVQSAITVDQSLPRFDAATNSGSDAAPTILLASAIDQLVFSQVVFGAGSSITDTPDGSWITDFNLKNSFTDIYLVGQHKIGASSVTRLDALSGSIGWSALGVALKAADSQRFFLIPS